MGWHGRRYVAEHYDSRALAERHLLTYWFYRTSSRRPALSWEGSQH